MLIDWIEAQGQYSALSILLRIAEFKQADIF